MKPQAGPARLKSERNTEALSHWGDARKQDRERTASRRLRRSPEKQCENEAVLRVGQGLPVPSSLVAPLRQSPSPEETRRRIQWPCRRSTHQDELVSE